MEVTIWDILSPIVPLIVLTIVLPFVKRLIISKVKDKENALKKICLIASLFFIASLTLILLPNGVFWKLLCLKKAITLHIIEVPGAISGFYIDAISMIFILITLFIAILSLIFSHDIVTSEDLPDLYCSLIGLLVLGLYFIFIAGDLVSLFVAWELMSVATYALIFIRRSNVLAMEAGTKYLIMSAVASTLMLYAISLIYGYTGSFDFITIHEKVLKLTLEESRGLLIALTLLTLSFGFKAVIVPFHTWAPDVYQETLDPITVILSGAASKVGIYCLIRVYYLLLPYPHTRILLAILAIVTMTVGNITALLQNDLKRLFAYSSIAHMGYIVASLSTGTVMGIAGTLMHSINHAIMKSLAFFCISLLSYQINSREVAKMKGFGRLDKYFSITFTICLLALAGMPGLNGFISKFIIVASLIDAGLIWLVVGIIINFGIAVAYYIRLIQIMYSQVKSEKLTQSKSKKVSIYMKAPIAILTILCFIIGLYPSPILKIVLEASKVVFSA